MESEVPVAPEVFARHQLVRRVDSGGQVEYYEARSETGERHFLIRLPAGDPRWPPWANPLLARILVHPNIVQLLDCRVFDERPYAVLEYVPGLSLRELMSLGRVPAGVACFLVAEVCRGLVRALDCHGMDGSSFSWAHGQLCPRAIRITPEGGVKISGFGLGRLKPEGRPSREGVAFLSPEQVRLMGDDVTPAMDVFALGAILHALISLEPMIAEESVIEYLREHVRLRKEATTFSRLDGQVSAPLAQVAAKMLASDPDRRFVHAGAVLEALTAVPEMRDGPSLANQLAAVVQASLSRSPARADP